MAPALRSFTVILFASKVRINATSSWVFAELRLIVCRFPVPTLPAIMVLMFATSESSRVISATAAWRSPMSAFPACRSWMFPSFAETLPMMASLIVACLATSCLISAVSAVRVTMSARFALM